MSYGFEVTDNDGHILTSESVFFSMQQSEVFVPPYSQQTIRPEIATTRVAYALTPVSGMSIGFLMVANADGSLYVNNNCGFTACISILRY